MSDNGNLSDWLSDPNDGADNQPPALSDMFGGDGGFDRTAYAYAHQVAREDLDIDKYVSKTKSLISVDVHMPEFIRGLQLTRSHEIDDRQLAEFREALRPIYVEHDVKLNETEFNLISQVVYDHLLGLGPLGGLWRDDSISEIMLVGHDLVYIERSGELHKVDVKFSSVIEAQECMRNLARQANRELSIANPVVDAQLADGGARLLLMLEPVVTSGVHMTLRKRGEMMTMEDLVGFGSLTPEMAAFLGDAVRAQAAILISGGTGSGKTTIINAVSTYIPEGERVWTIEDTLELQLKHQHVVRVQEKQRATQDDKVQVTQADLIRASLRGRPDRILVGEMRDPIAANVMVQASESGHDGTMTTIHANSPDEAVNQRLYGFVSEARSSAPDRVVRQMILNGFQLVVQVTRGRGGKRFTRQIALVGDELTADGFIPVIPLWKGELDEDGNVVHTRVNRIPRGSRMHERFLDVGVDPTPWLDPEGN